MYPTMTEDEINEFNEKNHKETAQQFKEFKADVAAGKCWVCKEPLSNFDENKPCQHWLLRPEGFRKKHFKKLFETCTFDKLEGFLRWYVNVQQPFKNINDLKEEHDGDKIKALTIMHDNLEWSFSFSKNCVEGSHGIHGPHYHFQMRVDGRPLHDYSDRHIKLTDYELWLLDIEQGKHPQIKRGELYGMGMQGTVDDIEPEELLKAMRNTDDYGNAAFNVSSLVMADEGHTISGDDIADIMEESKRTGVPMHQLVKRLQNVKTRVFIEPGPGVPVAAQRTPRNRRKKRRAK